MKKLTASVLILVLSSSMAIANAQQKKSDTVRTQDIEGVVVTALGIKREKKSLGYATQEVKGDDVNKNPTPNFLNNLSGQVAGLDVKQSTNFGGSINVVLRGFKSFSGTNQPLFVIDGVPIINGNVNTTSQTSGRYGYDYGNAASDINPNDIETINVLKGATAATLYGSRAANGAIIITTKKGKKNKGVGIEFSSSVTVSTIDRTTFPKYQTEYGQGYSGEDEFGTYNGGLAAGFGSDASYGPKYDPNLMVYQYDAFIPGSPNFGKATPWVAAKNGPISFFNKGTNYTNSISFSGGNDVSTYRLSYSNMDATDIMPNSELIKNNFGGNASYKLSDKLTASLFANYITQKTVGRNGTGYNGNIMGNFRQWWPTNIDIKQQQNLYNLTHQNSSWNITDPTNLTPQYWDNVYFQRYQNYQNDNRERFNGNFSLSYDVTPNLNLLARLTTDSYTMTTEERLAAGSVPVIFGQSINTEQPSGYATNLFKFAERNFDFLATYKKNITEDLNINGLVGTNVRYESNYSIQQSTSGGLLIPNLFTISNSRGPAFPALINDTSKQVIGVFAQASLGYKNTYYLEGTIRRDQTTALAPGHDVYWYPSVSGSMVFSNLIKQSWLSFGKIRANYSEVGNDTPANQLQDVYTVGQSFGEQPTYFYNTLKKNPDLVAERLKSIEFGLETSFLKNRAGLDVTWYRNDSKDLISNVSVPYSSGSLLEKQNIGNLRTEAFEITLRLTPIKSQDFSWNLSANWSNPVTKVTKLKAGLANIALQTNTSSGGVTINAPLGELYGQIWGTDFIYAPDGQKIIDPNTGAYLVSTETNNNLGSYQAKWFGGLRNTFTYKNISLAFLIDMKKGGSVYSLDQSYGYGTGIYPDSVGFNDLGNPIRNTLADGGGVIQQGVIPDPNNPGHFIQNNVRLDRSVSSQTIKTDLPASAYVYDASYVKLREASITYNLSKEALGSKFIQGMSFSLIGGNLWIIHKNLPYADPEAGLSSGNLQGYQTGVMPTTRNISFNVKVNF
ncbi:TonB-linked SusC/RagA family outer membrane protein [Chryseobacterium sp. H1D6B]|uniref:SusC/RagA family TonB-linked outer membrane protein n=1 Tax=Chryseobacterium sp. H1D6B TaxID=2940588 RepID=UPI0015C841B4|nr:SusC/RagA family TonB-linked outer membrane protein [Chryseobacterium sp. H1D6B]MDH6251003.1 TonB-linked SusC/RagA family outer membrane protein [Chryseobacterium sp. H1D6B]